MVVAVETMLREAPAITKTKIVELIRQEIDSSGYTLQQASVKVCADLIDQGFKDALFDLFVCEGMEVAYRRSLAGQRSGEVESQDVKPAVAASQDVESVAAVEDSPPAPERPPNAPYDPTKARGIGDRIIQELPTLTGRLAAPYWVADGRYKPLGHLSVDELEVSIARTETMADSYQHSLRFQKRVRAGMGKEHKFVYQAFPDQSILEKLYEISSGPAKP